MNIIAEVRRDREELARVLKKHPGIRKIVEDLYPDSAHFIYELLQNAEDAKNEQGKGATEASFALSETCLVFEHNGQAFDKGDIEAITDIGEGTKAEDEDKIGRFGVGFKAVFVYTETPHIWSPTFSFRIEDFVLPNEIESKSELGNKTRFEFPFNNPKKMPKDAYVESKAGLNELAETTLLFLTNLEIIRWSIGQETSGVIQRIQHSENHFEVLKQVNGKTTTNSHFLKFDQPVPGLRKQRVAIAYALDFLPKVPSFDPDKRLAEQLKIVPAVPGHVAVFFPADKETSNLRFHLHAPFVPELSRASIKETPVNSPLFEQLAMLTATSLHNIRDLGLLSTDFLGVLPNHELAYRYEGIRSAIVEAMNTESLTPTYSKSHEPARDLLQARVSLKRLLSKEDLEFLVDYDETPPQWAVGATQKNSDIDRFLGQLSITDSDISQFVSFIRNDETFLSWLDGKSIGWHQQFYALLYRELNPNGHLYLKNACIIRLANSEYSLGNKSFFPDDQIENNDGLPRVEAGVYTSGKNKGEKEDARKFLEEMGVQEIGETERIEAILEQRYTAETKFPNEKNHWNDLKRFIALVKQEPDNATLFKGYYIFWCIHHKWGTPGVVFLDKPFLDTELTVYFDAIDAIGEKAGYFALTENYLDGDISPEDLAEFAKAVGAKTELIQINQYSDYQILHLEELLKTPSLKLSKLIWRAMQSSRYADMLYLFLSKELIDCLRSSEWIPQNPNPKKHFVRPENAVSGLLPKGFPYDSGWEWLKEIHFGEKEAKKLAEKTEEEAKKLAEKTKETQEEARAKEIQEKAMKELGFDDLESLEDAKWFDKLPKEEKERIRAEYEPKDTPELPEHEPKNPSRRSKRVREGAVNAAERNIEQLSRSVSVNRESVKKEAEPYLQEQYTNSDGDMICQVCQGPLPFKLDDGNDYFEKVEFLTELQKHHFQNYLALCPNHAAMFQYANGSTDIIRQEFVAMEGNQLDIVLAQDGATIYFTQMHIADLKTVIESDDDRYEE